MKINEFLPIKTAPKDGRLIRGYTPTGTTQAGEGYVMHVIRWDNDAGQWVTCDNKPLAPWDEPIYWAVKLIV